MSVARMRTGGVRRRERLAGEQRERVGLLAGGAGGAPDPHASDPASRAPAQEAVPVDRVELAAVAQERGLLDGDLVDQRRDRGRPVTGSSARRSDLGVRDAGPRARRARRAAHGAGSARAACPRAADQRRRSRRAASLIARPPAASALHSSLPISLSGRTRSTPALGGSARHAVDRRGGFVLRDREAARRAHGCRARRRRRGPCR